MDPSRWEPFYLATRVALGEPARDVVATLGTAEAAQVAPLSDALSAPTRPRRAMALAGALGHLRLALERLEIG